MVQIHPPLLLYKGSRKNFYIISLFRDFGRVTFDVPHREVLLLLFIQALKRELGQEEGAPGLLRNSLIKTAAKTLADEVKEAIKESHDIEN